MTPPSIEDQLKELILAALAVPYVSTSCKDAIETGNHYQSVAFGQTYSQGFRSDRGEFLDRISLEGKKVLDLGSNLGEVSRAARRRGACLVDGFEYDPFFVEIACALNALNKTTRVSFYECDMTDPNTYRESYDIVLAFSVAHYVYPILSHLEGIVENLLVVETHRLQDNLESDYIANVSEYFPAHRVLGYSDWSISNNEGGQRAVIALARSEDVFALALRQGKATPEEFTSKRKVS
jgi:SAM-dependent methyltransferase